MSILNDQQWNAINQETGHDILDIVMDLVHNRATANETANRIAARCEASALAGAAAEREWFSDTEWQLILAALARDISGLSYKERQTALYEKIERRIRQQLM